ncbi:MAG: AAC(3) family N-acetyltransferase [Pseudodesulfovibrio sp.]
MVCCGVNPGDSLLVHSALFNLGMLEGSSPRTLCADLYAVFREYLGDKGTLLIPTFFYDYARHGIPYDLQSSPPDKGLGVFVEYLGLRPEMVRSFNPLFNLSGVGPQAEFICRGNTASAWGINSPWDRMTDVDAKIIGFGSPFIHSCTYMMYVEQRVGSPHMYNKVYRTPVYDGGKPVDKLVTAFVRYLDFGVRHDFNRLSELGEKKGVIRAARLGSGRVVGFSCREMLEFGAARLSEDPFFFLAKVPEFRENELPLI